MAGVDNAEDILDSRDIIERIEELENDEDRDDCDNIELEQLRKLAEDGENHASDWKYGATLIRDSYFEDYARELAEDCGMIPRDLAWPCTCIDWEQAARELRMDYASLDFDGVKYWVRA